MELKAPVTFSPSPALLKVNFSNRHTLCSQSLVGVSASVECVERQNGDTIEKRKSSGGIEQGGSITVLSLK